MWFIKQSCQAELDQLQSRHSGEVSKLQRHIDDLDNQLIRMQMTVVKAQTQAQAAPAQQAGNRWGEWSDLMFNESIQ